MNRPKVSVIVPVYNAENYLTECMESLVHQTLKEIEIIAINDGSTDNSLDILRKYESAYPNVHVYSQDDLGQANACNRGLNVAIGDYVAECDADDFVALNMYEKLYEASEGKADAVRCGFISIINGQLIPSKLHAPEEVYGSPLTPRELKGTEKIMVFGRPCSIPSGIYKRMFLINNGIKYREGFNYEDTSLEFRIKSASDDYRILPDCLYYYRRDNPNSGSATIKDSDALIEQFEEIGRFNKKHGLNLMDYMNAYRFYTYKWHLSRLKEEEDVEYFLSKIEKDMNDNPAPQKYFKPEDYKEYILIRTGFWRGIYV